MTPLSSVTGSHPPIPVRVLLACASDFDCAWIVPVLFHLVCQETKDQANEPREFLH